MNDDKTAFPLPDISQRVIEAIGQDNPDADWKLRPEAHLASFPNPLAAAPLITLLQHSHIRQITAHYEQANKAAKAAQDQYKKWGRREIFATMTATIFGAFALLQPQTFFGLPQVRGITIIIQFSALFLVFLAAWWLRRKSYQAEWHKARGKAEIARIDLFDKVMALRAEATKTALPLLPLKLEYFRRYQLDIQRRYYQERGEEHRKALLKSLGWRMTSQAVYIFAIIMTIPAALILFDKMAWFSWASLVDFIKHYPGFANLVQMTDKSLLGIGVITSAVHAASTARTRMDMDERNAARYQMTSDNLEYLTQTGLDKARRAAVEGREAEVLGFVKAVQRQISTEHREWVSLREREAQGVTALTA